MCVEEEEEKEDKAIKFVVLKAPVVAAARDPGLAGCCLSTRASPSAPPLTRCCRGSSKTRRSRSSSAPSPATRRRWRRWSRQAAHLGGRPAGAGPGKRMIPLTIRLEKALEQRAHTSHLKPALAALYKAEAASSWFKPPPSTGSISRGRRQVRPQL